MTNSIITADLCDLFERQIRVAQPLFRSFGEVNSFYGPISTVSVLDDNVLVKEKLKEKVDGKVLVVDGKASTRCALMGDNLARLASENGWAGVIINGCIRDVDEINKISIGIRAVATCPKKSIKKGEGQLNVPVSFAGVTFTPGHYVYVDSDGIIISENDLEQV
jgi:regulator of ribonuclease activity A